MDTYHKVDLKNQLIEQGIALVGRQGAQALSLRKVAAACGVTHAAPYAHFKNKEELLMAMKEHITSQFSNILEECIKVHEQDPDLLDALGKTYVAFFVQHPDYFSFLFYQSNFSIDLTMKENSSGYRPFDLYRSAVINILDAQQYPKEGYQDVIISLWSFVHGIASLATMKQVRYDGIWEEKVSDYMRLFDCDFLKKRVLTL